jgi:hypothetical protein
MKYNFKYLMYRAAVYNNMLKFEVILIEHALNAFFNEFGAIVRRGDDGNFGKIFCNHKFYLSFSQMYISRSIKMLLTNL